jgi:hypothetical protein
MKRRWLLLALALLVAIPLAGWLKDFVRDSLLAPLLELLWLLRLEFESLPQSYLWIILIVIGLLLAAGSLLTSAAPRRRGLPPGWDRGGPVAVTARWLDLAAHGSYYKWRIARRLSELAVDALAQREHLTPEQVKQRLEEGELNVPPEIRAYVQAGLSSDLLSQLERPSSGFWSRAASAPLDLSPEIIVRFLEAEAEKLQ